MEALNERLISVCRTVVKPGRVATSGRVQRLLLVILFQENRDHRPKTKMVTEIYSSQEITKRIL
jgi:hypothetical protein